MENVDSKIDHGFLALMLGVKMRRRMFVKEHLDHNTEEDRYGGHLLKILHIYKAV